MDGVTKFYLLIYNNSCSIGWAYVLMHAILYITAPMGLSLFVKEVQQALFYVQMAAMLEVVHAMIGIVRSPVRVTFMQVSSRVVVLLFLLKSPNAMSSLGGGLMVLSWSLVEVPRYAFYMCAVVTGDATKKTPYWLFWLRYTLFIVLYPSGITGEILVYREALNDPIMKDILGGMDRYLWYFLLVIYVVGSPGMIFNMAMNRKNAFKKRFAKPAPPPRGIVFPLDDKGTRRSTEPAKKVLAAALQELNPSKAQTLREEKKWRFGYVKHFNALVEEQCKNSPEMSLSAAKAGLNQAYDLFEFIHEDGTTQSLKEAMASPCKTELFTGFVKGELQESGEIKVPYKGEILKGLQLKNQVQQWVSKGIIEASAGAAICNCVDHPEWIHKLKEHYFCLLGAGSAMGPFLVLMALGANVVAIDLDRPKIWQRLLDITKKSSGTLTFPLKEKVDCSTCKTCNITCLAGCNLFTQTPMIRDWLLNVHKGKPMTIGSYAYLDGAAHVQVSLAMDAICQDLTTKRPQTSLAYLCTPTDLHLIPKEASEESLKQYKIYSSKIFCKIMKLLNNKQFLKKNAKSPIQTPHGDELYYVNGLAVGQGPNYALAKRLQHWRAILAHQTCVVSSNIAPSTSTVSVIHNRQFAWAYQGMPYFKPFEIFAPDTSNSVMTAILLNDLFDTKGIAKPNDGTNDLVKNPYQLFQFGSFHGGAWRCAYEVGSIGESSVLIYFLRISKPYVITLSVVGVAVIAKFLY